MSTRKTKRAAPSRRRTASAAKPRKRHVPSPAAKARAAELAVRMPLVHFPASAEFMSWIDWGGLMSHAARGIEVGADRFSQLRGNHVFVYGGPLCYYHRSCVGDAALYFAPGAESARPGGATPFDSGSLEDSPPRLQPFRSRNASYDERWAFFEKYQVPSDSWRPSFKTWLAYCYDDPDRYMDTSADRYTAGEPDRLKPADLLKHNGSRGRKRYGAKECGDRRAWTWEVRIEATLPFENVALLHVPFDSMQDTLDAADKLRFVGGAAPRVKALPRGEPGWFKSLYEHSGAVLKELVA